MVDINAVLNDETWVQRSRPATDLSPQFAFLLSRTVYVGDPNSAEQLRSDAYNLPIAIPELGARDPLRPYASEALGREAQLTAYYREMMERTGKRPGPGAVGYWLRLEFVSHELNEPISFPWWDRVCEAAELFAWLRTAKPGGSGFFDCDQGWLFKAERPNDLLHFQYGNLDTGEEYANLKTDRTAFLGQLDRAETEVRTVIQRLKEHLGIDPWS